MWTNFLSRSLLIPCSFASDQVVEGAAIIRLVAALDYAWLSRLEKNVQGSAEAQEKDAYKEQAQPNWHVDV